jgi:hypothetical protein
MDEEILSPFARQMLNDISGKDSYSSTKLMTTLSDKKNYVLHYRNLQLYLKLGMKLTKVHRVLSFFQAPFLEKYVDHCTALRAKSTSVIQSNDLKLKANAIFGKSCEDKRSYTNLYLVVSKNRAETLVQSPFYKSFKIINEHLTAILLGPKEIKLDKPLQIGFSILELSKRFMYESYYLTFMTYFGGIKNFFLLMTDTDSIMAGVRTRNLGKAFKDLSHIMDFSNLPSTHKLHNNTHKNQLHRFKDETKGGVCSAFVGLKSKCYSVKSAKDKIVCKGVGRTAIKHRLKFDHYLNCLKKNCIKRTYYNTIEAKTHKLTSVRRNKIALSSFDSKRFIFNCGVHSAAYANVHIDPSGECYKCKLLM